MWAQQPSAPNIRTPRQNIMYIAFIRSKVPCKTAYELLFSIANMEVCTHRKNENGSYSSYGQKTAKTVRARYNRETKPELNDLDLVEFHAFFGVLNYWFVFKCNHQNLDTFLFWWNCTRNIQILKRVLVILACLRFDNTDAKVGTQKEIWSCSSNIVAFWGNGKKLTAVIFYTYIYGGISLNK